MTPRLTIGIPTHDRPELLPRALMHALTQTVPCNVIITDDGNAEATAKMLATRHPDLLESGQVRHIPRACTGLWDNWDACARACETEFFLWLQDDDVICKGVAERVIDSFDRFAEANVWMARNHISMNERFGWWQNGNGPLVPMDYMTGIPDQWEGEIFAPTSYFTSWSLSPAVAFRTGPAFTAALDVMPRDCALFAERLILVAMGAEGRFVADPMIAGLWVQHQGNNSRKLHDDQPRQTKVAIEFLDRAMDELGDRWRKILYEWAKLQHPNWVMGWLGDFDHAESEGGPSRYGRPIREVLRRSLEGRLLIRPVVRPWWRRIWDRVSNAGRILRWA